MLTTKTLRRFNNELAITVAFVAIFIMAWPMLPRVSWWVQSNAVASRLAVTPVATPAISSTPRIDIPKLHLSEAIYEGPGEATLAKGIWRRPHTSTPDQGSNTVLAGHRFTYYGKGSVFYHLDKLAVDDEITIDWSGKRYTYKVTDIQVVLPTAVAVESHTQASVLTLYTCTPLWSNSHRLVVRAMQVGEAAS